MSAFGAVVRQPSLFQMSHLYLFAFVGQNLRLAEFQVPIAVELHRYPRSDQKETHLWT